MHLATLEAGVVAIPRAQLAPGPWQPRRIFDRESLNELATSIRARGILSPLRVIPDQNRDRYLIVAGERRWRAARIAGLLELPCIVMNANAEAGDLHELAILDNLHRSNLKPGEEARAIADLQRLGLRLRDISRRLGKSQTWVTQRLAMARLPELALGQLDDGSITREEALGLARFADDPELVEACLEADGRRLVKRLGGHVPETVGERVQAIRRVLEMTQQRDAWMAKMRAEGHRVLDEPPSENDRRFSRLLSGSELSRAHQEARLSCEVWAWDRGQPTRYCNNAKAISTAMKQVAKLDAIEQKRIADQQSLLAREAARDATLRSWLATERGLDRRDLVLLARERIETLSAIDDRLLAMLGIWLGASGDRSEAIDIARKALVSASETRLIQLWFLLEAAHTMAAAVVPSWLVPCLGRLGFVDPLGAAATSR